jgi:hypothetical protein
MSQRSSTSSRPSAGSSRGGSSGPSRTAPDTPDRAEEAVNTFLKTQPDLTNIYELHQWVIALVGYLMSWIRLLFAALGTRMQTLERLLEKRVDETDAVVSVLNNQVKAHAASIATAVQDVQALAAATVVMGQTGLT